jgi:hypothetical protein
MSSQLLDYIHARFRGAFGEPYSILDRDSQWSLRADGHPAATLAGSPTVFVLVNGSHEKPAVWVFDPYDDHENVWSRAVTSEQDVDEAIERIYARIGGAPDAAPATGV